MSQSLFGSNIRSMASPYSGSTPFPDPFNDIATTQMPTTINSALWWAEFIWFHQGMYAMAMRRIASYFLTDVELSGGISNDEKEKYMDQLYNGLDVLTFLYTIGNDRLCYNNSFFSILVPFQRFLRCPSCGDMTILREVATNSVFNFQFTGNFDFVATCPRNNWRGPWEVIDKPRDESQKLILKRWNPHEIELLHDPHTDDVTYLWRIPEYYKNLIREGNLFHLERANMQALRAIQRNELFEFKRDAIFHMKEPTLAGLRNRGWGIPAALTHFRQIWHLQVLRRQNEAIGLDYVIPFRLLTPAPRGGMGAMGGVATSDPLAILNGSDFNAQIKRMINRRRTDPAGWYSLPFPVNYQMLGADANSLVPTELMAQATDALLNETGTPVEFYKGTMNMQSAPVSFRLFESTHRPLVSDMNRALQWICNTLSRILMWEPVKAELRRVTIADDIQKQMAALQLMAGRQLSGTSGLRALGYDYKTERQFLMEEAKLDQELQARQQEEMEQAGFAAEVAKGVNPFAPPPPQDGPGQAGPQGQGVQEGGPAGAQLAAAGGTPVSQYVQSMSPDAPVTPSDIEAAADMLATELLGLPELQKDQQLRELKKFNPTLHSVVIEKLAQKRKQMRDEGGQMLMQQQYGTA